MPGADGLNFDEERSLTGAVLVLLGSEGLRIPGLDPVACLERHGPVALGLPELLILNQLRLGGRPMSAIIEDVADQTGADPERLREVVGKLWARGLLITGKFKEPDPRPGPSMAEGNGWVANDRSVR